MTLSLSKGHNFIKLPESPTELSITYNNKILENYFIS